MDAESILALLAHPAFQRVKTIRMEGLEIELYPAATTIAQEAPRPPTPSSSASADPLVPTELRADDLMNFDKIMHWSSGGDAPDPTEMPLTGDAPITEGIA